MLLTAYLAFPLSFIVLTHSLFTHPILLHIQSTSSGIYSAEWLRLVAYQFLFLLLSIADFLAISAKAKGKLLILFWHFGSLILAF